MSINISIPVPHAPHGVERQRNPSRSQAHGYKVVSYPGFNIP